MSHSPSQRHYFVDEAGDLVLFNKRGRIIVGEEGCSKYFILGATLIENPHDVRKKLQSLKRDLLNDPYLKKIPSIAKTASSFHATDDCPEVRREVYKLLSALPIKIYTIVRRKGSLIDWVHNQNQYDRTWRYSADKIYDSCVKRLFKDRLHQADENFITFARRGKSERNTALLEALTKAKKNFEKKWGKTVTTKHQAISNYPSNEPCLEVIDYCLWALQRLYERHEDRYFDFLSDKYQRIIDLDDKRTKGYGVYYDSRNPLNVDKIKSSLLG